MLIVKSGLRITGDVLFCAIYNIYITIALKNIH